MDSHPFPEKIIKRMPLSKQRAGLWHDSSYNCASSTNDHGCRQDCVLWCFRYVVEVLTFFQLVLDNGQIVSFWLFGVDSENNIYLFLCRLNMTVLRHYFKRKGVISKPWLTAVEIKRRFMLLLNKIKFIKIPELDQNNDIRLNRNDIEIYMGSWNDCKNMFFFHPSLHD